MKDQILELRALITRINNLELPHVKLEDIAPICPKINQQEFEQKLITLLKGGEPDFILLDVRSEKEFAKDGLPFATNLPILDNDERHKVGLLYMQKSQELAVQVAAYYLQQKQEKFIAQIRELAAGKPIVAYCWRGGGRSRAATHLLREAGFDALQLSSGQKGWRKRIHRCLYQGRIECIAFDGNTGSGKSELLEYLQDNNREIPVLHLEQAAFHAASVYGEIRFRKQGTPPNQQQFEQNLYLQFLLYPKAKFFFTEQESRRIGSLNVPPGIWSSLESGRNILLKCSLEQRVTRLCKEYFGENDPEAVAAVRKQTFFLKKFIGNAKLDQYLQWIDEGNYASFLADVLIIHYDKLYKCNTRSPECEIDMTSIEQAAQEVQAFFQKLI